MNNLVNIPLVYKYCHTDGSTDNYPGYGYEHGPHHVVHAHHAHPVHHEDHLERQDHHLDDISGML